jgi:hypothetical protein
MKRMTDRWTLPCSAETFWRVFMDAEYSRALYLDAFRFNDYRVIMNDGTTRKLYVAPRVNLPGPLAKLAGDKFAYEQHGSLDRAQGVFSWKMVHPGGKGMVSSDGTIRVLDAGEARRCTRIDEVAVSGHVFGLGGLIESSAEKELRASWATEIAFLERWLKERGLT